MVCYICNKKVSINSLALTDESGYDKVVETYSLIRCQGPEEQFDSEGTVVVCRYCVKSALQGTAK